jgi:hypothetical protein
MQPLLPHPRTRTILPPLSSLRMGLADQAIMEHFAVIGLKVNAVACMDSAETRTSNRHKLYMSDSEAYQNCSLQRRVPVWPLYRSTEFKTPDPKQAPFRLNPGRFDMIGQSGVPAMHCGLLPNGRVVFLDKVENYMQLKLPDGQYAYSSEYDPLTSDGVTLDGSNFTVAFSFPTVQLGTSRSSFIILDLSLIHYTWVIAWYIAITGIINRMRLFRPSRLSHRQSTILLHQDITSCLWSRMEYRLLDK